MTSMPQPVIENVGLGWPESTPTGPEVSRETVGEAVGLGWPE